MQKRGASTSQTLATAGVRLRLLKSPSVGSAGKRSTGPFSISASPPSRALFFCSKSGPCLHNNYDYILCADSNNIRNTIRITGADRDDKIKLLLDFALDSKKHGKSIADPWYTGNFSDTYYDIVDGLEGFLKFLEKNS